MDNWAVKKTKKTGKPNNDASLVPRLPEGLGTRHSNKKKHTCSYTPKKTDSTVLTSIFKLPKALFIIPPTRIRRSIPPIPSTSLLVSSLGWALIQKVGPPLTNELATYGRSGLECFTPCPNSSPKLLEIKHPMVRSSIVHTIHLQ